MARDRPSRGGSSGENVKELFLGMKRDLKALDSSVMILSQKMNQVTKNEKILSRNLLVLNKKIANVQEQSSSSSGTGLSSEEVEDLNGRLKEISDRSQELSKSLSEIRGEIESIKANFAKKDVLLELKYVIDSINPLEFVTFKQLDDYLEKKGVR